MTVRAGPLITPQTLSICNWPQSRPLIGHQPPLLASDWLKCQAPSLIHHLSPTSIEGNWWPFNKNISHKKSSHFSKYYLQKVGGNLLQLAIPYNHFELTNSDFSQVVIERPSLRPDSKGTSKEAEEDVVMLYIAQLAALAVLLTAM